MKWRLFISVVITFLFNLINIYLAISAFVQEYYYYTFAVAAIIFVEKIISHQDEACIEGIIHEIVDLLRMNTVVSASDIQEIRLGSVYLMTFVNTFYYLTEYKMVRINALGQINIFISLELFILILDSVYIPIIQGGDQGFKFKAILNSVFGHLAYYTSIKCIFYMEDDYGNSLAFYLIGLMLINLIASVILFQEKIKSFCHKVMQVVVGFLSNYQWIISAKYKKQKVYNRDCFLFNISLFNQIVLLALILFNCNIQELILLFLSKSNHQNYTDQSSVANKLITTNSHFHQTQLLNSGYFSHNSQSQPPSRIIENQNVENSQNFYHEIFLLEAIIASIIYLLISLKQVFNDVFVNTYIVLNEETDYVDTAKYLEQQLNSKTPKKYYITALSSDYDYKDNYSLKSQLLYIKNFAYPSFQEICKYCKLQMSISQVLKMKDKNVIIKCGQYSETNKSFQCTCLYSIYLFCFEECIHSYNYYLLSKSYYQKYLPYVYFYRYFNGLVFTQFSYHLEKMIFRLDKNPSKANSLQITTFYKYITPYMLILPQFIIYDLYIDH